MEARTSELTCPSYCEWCGGPASTDRPISHRGVGDGYLHDACRSEAERVGTAVRQMEEVEALVCVQPFTRDRSGVWILERYDVEAMCDEANAPLGREYEAEDLQVVDAAGIHVPVYSSLEDVSRIVGASP